MAPVLRHLRRPCVPPFLPPLVNAVLLSDQLQLESGVPVATEVEGSLHLAGVLVLPAGANGDYFHPPPPFFFTMEKVKVRNNDRQSVQHNETKTFVVIEKKKDSHLPVQVHLFHDTALEAEQGGKVHPPPKVSEDEISKEEVMAQEDKIKELVDAGFGTTELHKYLQRDGKPLGEAGKQKVRACSACVCVYVCVLKDELDRSSTHQRAVHDACVWAAVC